LEKFFPKFFLKLKKPKGATDQRKKEKVTANEQQTLEKKRFTESSTETKTFGDSESEETGRGEGPAGGEG
jgi:hypothetical protein